MGSQGERMERHCPDIKFSLADDSGLLKAICLQCSCVIGWSKNPKILAIAALMHTCETTDRQPRAA
jgi:hypothetical protein